jgi:hypothetical protein
MEYSAELNRAVAAVYLAPSACDRQLPGWSGGALRCTGLLDSQDHTSEMDILASLGPVQRVFGIRTGCRNKGDRTRTRADDFASLIEDPCGTGDVKCRVGHGAECGRVGRATGGAWCGRGRDYMLRG